MSSSITREMPPANTLPRTGSGPREPGWWGMLLFCVTEAALFLYFLGGYFYLRGTVHAFAEEEGKFTSLTVPVVLTILLVTSSFTLRWGEQGIQRGDRRRLTAGLVATIVLGLSFLALQSMEYARQSHVPQSDAYWSAFYTITGFHGMHVVLGLLILGFNLFRTVKGHFTGDRHLAVENGSLYWHTVDIVWIGVVSSLYFAPRLW